MGRTDPLATCETCGARMPPGGSQCIACLIELALGAADRPGAGADAAAEGSASVRFGEYEILRDGPKLEGGMGVVYLARQVRLHRVVALKMLRGGILATPEQVSRFRAEAEAAARLDHPNIVPIYEIGEQDGRPYFTMKWMAGGSLAQVLRASRGRPNLPANPHQTTESKPEQILGLSSAAGFTPREAARLLATVARAVHHAHQRGVIHRDLKPSNILLDPESQPHVADFGLAKRLDSDSALTLTGDTLGTPNYMAPEQAEGKARDVTIAADIYSLGTILYELLTGQPPFSGSTPASTMRQVVGQEPERPCKISRHISRDLETICLKCLEKEPHLRYSSAESLADDLERWLRGKPVLARPSGVWTHVVKWARRNPLTASLVAAVVVASVTGLIATLFQFERAARAHRQAVVNLETAHQAVQQLISLAGEDRLQEPGFDDLRNSILKMVVPFLEGFVTQAPGDNAFENERAHAYRDLGVSLQSLGRLAEAETNLLAALEVQARSAPSGLLMASHQQDMALTRVRYGSLLRDANRPTEAVAADHRALDLLKALAADDPTNTAYQGDLAGTYQELGMNLWRAGAPTNEFEEALLSAMQISRRLTTRPGAGASARFELGRACLNLGNVLSNQGQGRRAETEAWWQEALKVFSALAVESPANSSYQRIVALTEGRLGRLYADDGRWSQADESFKRCLQGMQQLVNSSPWRPSFQNDLTDEYCQIGVRRVYQGRTNEGVAMATNAIAREWILSRAHPENEQYRSKLRFFYDVFVDTTEYAGRTDEAEQACQSALTDAQGLSARQPGSTAARLDLAAAHIRFGKLMTGVEGEQAVSVRAHLAEGLAMFESLVSDFPTNATYRQACEDARKMSKGVRAR